MLGDYYVRWSLIAVVQKLSIDCPDGYSQKDLDNSVLGKGKSWEKLSYQANTNYYGTFGSEKNNHHSFFPSRHALLFSLLRWFIFFEMLNLWIICSEFFLFPLLILVFVSDFEISLGAVLIKLVFDRTLGFSLSLGTNFLTTFKQLGYLFMIGSVKVKLTIGSVCFYSWDWGSPSVIGCCLHSLQRLVESWGRSARILLLNGHICN